MTTALLLTAIMIVALARAGIQRDTHRLARIKLRTDRRGVRRTQTHL
jgi:hypothetical protein